MRTLIICTLISLFSIGCGNDLSDQGNSSEIPMKAEYDFTLTNKTTGEVTRLVATDVNTTWNIDDGYIFLSTDNLLDGQPIGTITMNIGSDLVDRGGSQGVIAQLLPGGIVSKTDQRVGTSLELNARTFEILLGWLSKVEANNTFIRATMDTCVLNRIFIPQGGFPEEATIKGTFTALRDN
ncbi:MAG: hypothetical protein HKN68_07125 [Saprospiraceae bacterium]|nr:hypothetical protein [Saprospiraceae bacterium]